MSNSTSSESLKDRLNGNILHWQSQMILKTCKFNIVNLERLQTALNGKRSLIITGWHGSTMMIAPLVLHYHPKVSDFVFLMPDDWRGMALKLWAKKLGGVPHPMNLDGDSTMATARQLVRLTRRVMGGKSLYINPDGPDGPAYVIKPGISFIAKKVDAVILPIGAYCRNAYIVPRWDRYAMPYPFSQITYHIGKPIENLPEDGDAANKVITDELNRVTLQASADYYEQPMQFPMNA